MRVVYNRYFPFGSYWAINLLGLVFARRDYGVLGPKELNHEYIHTLQQREMLFVAFYVWYVLEWLVRLVQYRHPRLAYRNISMEREAYAMQADFQYRLHRPLFAWRKWLFGGVR
ncbi:MAG: hypothetical protein IJR87_11525 [Bacteroidaceae bacterium]|nr:hypothetical protein [Bacteroidaceae bacterium]